MNELSLCDVDADWTTSPTAFIDWRSVFETFMSESSRRVVGSLLAVPATESSLAVEAVCRGSGVPFQLVVHYKGQAIFCEGWWQGDVRLHISPKLRSFCPGTIQLCQAPTRRLKDTLLVVMHVPPESLRGVRRTSDLASTVSWN